MCLNQVDLTTLFVSCLVLAGLPGAESNSKNRNIPVRTGELGRNPKLSSPEECARICHVNEPPKICYYHFTLELYNVLGNACTLCTRNSSDVLRCNPQCIIGDGQEKIVLATNRMVPGPSIEVCKDDRVVIDVTNEMDGMEVSIHWHGIFQKGSQYYDGVPMVTQCPIFKGNTFRYQWVAGNAGTHFWHSHSGLQKLDGLHGKLTVRQPLCKDPSSHLYDEDLSEHGMLISDWMRELAMERFPGRIQTRRGQMPDAVLINGKGQYTDRVTGTRTNTPLEVFTVKPGRRYRFRMVNSFCTICPAQIDIEKHNMTVIATDGVAVNPVDVGTLLSFAGERYDFVIHANQKASDYWIQVRALGGCGRERIQQLAILRYEGGPYERRSQLPTYDKGLPQGVILNPLDAICDSPRKDAICINQLEHAEPIDKRILRQPDIKIFVPYFFREYTAEQMFRPDTYNSFLVAPSGSLVKPFMDGISFKPPSAPPLSQYHDIPPKEFCNRYNRPASCGEFCSCSHAVDIPLKSMVELIIIDERGLTNLSHPFHLHGYAFNVVGMGRSPDKNVTKMTLRHARDLDKRGLLKRNWAMLPFKDTIAVPNNGYTIVRFCADNPGWWLFHCHFIYHNAIGMDMLLHVGTQKDLPPVPPGFPVCGNYLPPIKHHVEDDPVYLPKIMSCESRKPQNVSKKYLSKN